jgi:hypothetical protein
MVDEGVIVFNQGHERLESSMGRPRVSERWIALASIGDVSERQHLKVSSITTHKITVKF